MNSNLFIYRIYNNYGTGFGIHTANTTESGEYLVIFSLHFCSFQLGEAVDSPVINNLFIIIEFVDRSSDCLHVGQHTTIPAIADIEGTTFFSSCFYSIFGLFLCSDKKDVFSASCNFFQKHISLVDGINSLFEVYDMDSVTLDKNILLHLGIPFMSLMTKMDARF